MKLSWLKNKRIANKGLYNNIDVFENTLPAINCAIDGGYNLLLNLSITKDKQIVVCDSKKSNTLLECGKKIEYVCTTDENSLKLKDCSEIFLTLEQVLQIVDKKTGILFTIDNISKAKQIANISCKTLKNYKGNFAIIAKTYSLYNYIKKINKSIPCGVISGNNHSKLTYNFIFFASSNWLKLLKPDFIVCDINSLPNKYLDNYLKFYPYTYIIAFNLKTDSHFRKSIKYADNFIFDKQNKQI